MSAPPKTADWPRPSPAALSTDDLLLYNAARSVADGDSSPSPELAEVQNAFRGGNYREAITLLRTYLDGQALSLGRYPLDGPRLNALLEFHYVKQKNLAQSIAVSPSTVTQLSNHATLDLSKILLIAAILEVPPVQLIRKT